MPFIRQAWQKKPVFVQHSIDRHLNRRRRTEEAQQYREGRFELTTINPSLANTRRRKIIAAALLIAVLIGITSFWIFSKSQQKVGDYNLNIPGAEVNFQDNGTGAGNLKEYTLKGQKTKVHIVFDDIMSAKGVATLADVNAEMESTLATQKETLGAHNLTEIGRGSLASSKVQGFYQFASLTDTRNNIVLQRNLFFLRDGKPYKVTFWYTKTGVDSDEKLAVKTWQTLIDGLGIPASSFPIVS